MDGLSSSGRASLPLSPRLHSFTKYGPGVLLCAAIALPANELSGYHQSLDALAISLIVGIVLRNVLGPITSIQPGIWLTSAVFIPVGIILYGTRLDFQTFSQLPLYTTGIVF
ncbi:MAG: putative sulfate exporter family transporter, partial [Actinomycetota bacterium]